jgi:hypothetical protein
MIADVFFCIPTKTDMFPFKILVSWLILVSNMPFLVDFLIKTEEIEISDPWSPDIMLGIWPAPAAPAAPAPASRSSMIQ